MAFGNMGDDSGTGVAFTRDPSTGENKFYGEFLINAQGEDVVAGIRTPQPVEPRCPSLDKKVYKQLLEIKDKLEAHYKDMQDIEFTIEQGTLYMLQTRTGKRTGAAAVKIAVDMVKEKLIDEKTAVKRIPANDLTQLLLPSFDPKAKDKANLATGLPASRRRRGQARFTADEAVERTKAGEKVLLVPQGNQPRGRRRHALRRGHPHLHRRHDLPRRRRRPRLGQVLRRRRRRDHHRLQETRKITVGEATSNRRTWISIDGSTGEVFAGEITDRPVESRGCPATSPRS